MRNDGHLGVATQNPQERSVSLSGDTCPPADGHGSTRFELS